MRFKDQLKVMQVGFILLRRDYRNSRIKCKTHERNEWHNLENGFASKAALDRRMDVLLQDNQYIED